MSTARQNGRSLFGVAPAHALGPIPPEWVVARGCHWLRAWPGRTDDTAQAAFMVLTACRIWRFATAHVHTPKAVAARWALTQDPSLSAITQALRRHEGDTSTVVDEPGITDVLTKALRVSCPS